MQVEIVPADQLIRPMIGDGGLSREQAHAEIQSVLDGSPRLAQIAALWRRGAKDDTVQAGPFCWCIYEYDGDGPRPAAVAWLEDYAATIRSAGIDVQVARLPD